MTRTLVALFMLTLVAGCSADQQTADVIYTNGKIYTVNEAQPWAEAEAITRAGLTPEDLEEAARVLWVRLF